MHALRAEHDDVERRVLKRVGVGDRGARDHVRRHPDGEPVYSGSVGAVANMTATPCTISGAMTIATNSTIGFWNGAAMTLNGLVSGPGKITSQNGGVVTLTNNANNYSGGTLLRFAPDVPANPFLRATASNALGSGLVTLTAGTLQLVSTAAMTLPNALSIASGSSNIMRIPAGWCS